MTAVTQYYRLGDLTEIYVLTGLEAKLEVQIKVSAGLVSF